MLGPREKIQRKYLSVPFQDRDTVPSQVPGLLSGRRFLLQPNKFPSKKPMLVSRLFYLLESTVSSGHGAAPALRGNTSGQYLETRLVFPSGGSFRGVGDAPLIQWAVGVQIAFHPTGQTSHYHKEIFSADWQSFPASRCFS